MNINLRVDQFHIQCTNNNENIDYLAKELSEILRILSVQINDTESNIATKIPFTDPRQCLIRLYKLIGQTRDIHGGRGEYNLAYMMIWEWYQVFPQMAMLAFYYFVTDLPNGDKPYGSWKDVKYLCRYVLLQCDNNIEKALNNQLVKYCIDLMNCQLKCDEDSYMNTENPISLVSKWIPREARNKPRKFNWLYEALATDYYFDKYLYSIKDVEGRERAFNKCKANYRILCSKLNRYLDTIQIKQCSGKWSEIDHSKTTAITMSKQYYALSNRVSSEATSEVSGEIDTKIVRSVDPDRIQCAENLRIYLESKNAKIKCGINDNQVILDKLLINERYQPLESYANSILYKENIKYKEEEEEDDSMLFSINLSNNMINGLTSKMCFIMLILVCGINTIFYLNIVYNDILDKYVHVE